MTRGSRFNACRLLSLEPIGGQSVQKYTPHNRTIQRRCTPRDTIRQRRHFGKSIPEFGETHSSVLGCERRPVPASIMSRSCFASFPVCVYKFSSHYLNNIIFIDNSLRSLVGDSPCIISARVLRRVLETLRIGYSQQRFFEVQIKEIKMKNSASLFTEAGK